MKIDTLGVQAFIAIGRGDWTGVGLGGSILKLDYLPEAHTDFIFSVTAEEFGFVGVCVIVALFAVFAWRAFSIGNRWFQSSSRSAPERHGLQHSCCSKLC